MKTFLNQTVEGSRYRHLVVVCRLPNKKKYDALWLCRCDCGNEKAILQRSLRAGYTTSCGCKRTKHGQYGTKTYKIWHGMLDRCRNPSHAAYRHYGGRGIKVCERWHDFQYFLDDMGSVPEGMSLDRINNHGDYEPGNARWASWSTQCNNRRSNHKVELNGKSYTLAQLAKLTGINPRTLQGRLARGMSVGDAASKQAQRGRPRL